MSRGRNTVRRVAVSVATTALLVAGLALSQPASAHEKGIKVSLNTALTHFVAAPGSNVYYSTDWDNYTVYRYGGWYYVYDRGTWYRSRSARELFVPIYAGHVPNAVVDVAATMRSR